MLAKRIMIKKLGVLILNFVGFVTLFYLQNMRYYNLLNYKFESAHDDVLRNAGLMWAGGNDLNWILVLSLIFLILNLFLFRNWVKAKRWFIESFIILIVTITIGMIYHFHRIDKIQDKKDAIDNIQNSERSDSPKENSRLNANDFFVMSRN